MGAAAAEENMQEWELVWKWRDTHRAGAIQFLIKVSFKYYMKVAESGLVAWNCKSSLTHEYSD